MNFALRHPDLATGAVSMGGAFDVHQFLDGYYDDNCYYNCPPDFLPNLNDAWYLDRYRRQRLVLATGETDICLDENRRLSLDDSDHEFRRLSRQAHRRGRYVTSSGG